MHFRSCPRPPDRCRQCEWGLPVPHIPQELGTPEHDGPSAPPPDAPAATAAKDDIFFSRRVDPHFGHTVPFQFEERTKSSWSFPQSWQKKS